MLSWLRRLVARTTGPIQPTTSAQSEASAQASEQAQPDVADQSDASPQPDAPAQAAAQAQPQGPEQAPEAAPPTVIHGVDVASYQGPPAHWRNEAGKIRWAAVKLTELGPDNARYFNPDAAADWAFLADQGLGRVAYLFAHPSVDVAATVDFFISQLIAVGLTEWDMVMLDLEVTDGLGPAQVDAWASEVMSSLQTQLGRPPILYTFLSFAEEGNTASLGSYALWIADPSSPPGQPRVPLPWQQWTIHQYDISGPIDHDVANFPTLPAMQLALGKPKEPQVQDLGGTIAGDVTAVRWDNQVIVVAGLGADGFVQIRRFHPEEGIWGAWRDVSPTKAIGAPGLVAWGTSNGQLYYTNEAGAVIELATEDTGFTWT
jgi:GH25 family lysozyme M1 (1,4-beta-N-acetylmuramidase)